MELIVTNVIFQFARLLINIFIIFFIQYCSASYLKSTPSDNPACVNNCAIDVEFVNTALNTCIKCDNNTYGFGAGCSKCNKSVCTVLNNIFIIIYYQLCTASYLKSTPSDNPACVNNCTIDVEFLNTNINACIKCDNTINGYGVNCDKCDASACKAFYSIYL